MEDTDTSFSEIEELFGAEVRRVVEEVTDDKTLPKAERKRLQVERAAGSSPRAKLVKLADKLYNLRDLNRCTPEGTARTVARHRAGDPARSRVAPARWGLSRPRSREDAEGPVGPGHSCSEPGPAGGGVSVSGAGGERPPVPEQRDLGPGARWVPGLAGSCPHGRRPARGSGSLPGLRSLRPPRCRT